MQCQHIAEICYKIKCTMQCNVNMLQQYAIKYGTQCNAMPAEGNVAPSSSYALLCYHYALLILC